MITIRPLNHVHHVIDCESGIFREIQELFTFVAPGYQHTPAYRNRLWDGKIRLINARDRKLLVGLTETLCEFARDIGYEVQTPLKETKKFNVDEANHWVSFLNLPFPLRDYQLSTFIDAVNAGRQTIVSPTACHAKGDTVLMSSGKFKNIENILIGDSIIGADGKSKKVLKIFSGEDELFDIQPRGNKSKITVTGNHLLPLKFSDYSKGSYGYAKGDKNFVNYVSVNEYIKKSKYYKHCSNIFYNDVSIEYSSKEFECKLSPYFIGAYLGDGSCGTCQVTNIDKEVIDEVYKQAEIMDMNVRHCRMGYYITRKTIKGNARTNPIFQEFKKFGLKFGKDKLKCNTKFIPEIFLTASKDFRLELLAGLIDTDGWLDAKTSFVFTSKSERLANDVRRLAISLGFNTSWKKKHNKLYDRYYFDVRIGGNIQNIPVRIPRKKDIIPTKKNTHNSKFDVLPKGKGEFYGIEVEDHLYITNGGMITHNSGKSLSIYTLASYLLHQTQGKCLVIVPTISLVHQMFSDFKSYGCDPDTMHKIYGGQTKDIDCQYIISTWQSLAKQPKSWFDQFNIVIGDECHLFKAKSLTSIMNKLEKAPYRYGFTGTLDSHSVHNLVLTGLFGPIKNVISTSELIEKKYLAELKVNCVLIKYPDEIRKACKEYTYQEEKQFIAQYTKRNKLIKKLASQLEGTVLVLFQLVEKQGKLLNDMFDDTRPVHYVHGGVEGEARELIRGIVQKQKNPIILASVGVYSTGVNIPQIDHIIFASPSKSRIRTLQSIGRGLRKTDTKYKCTLWDLADDLHWKSHKNFTLKHFAERVKMYAEQKFPYKMTSIDI